MSDYIGRETTGDILGQRWTFSRATRAVDVDFAEFARGLLPDPVEVMTRNLEKLSLRDAETLRQLQIADVKEVEKARTENRAAILMAPQYIPFADVMTRQVVQKMGTYQGFGSPEVNSVLASAEGMSYFLYLLLRRHHPEVTLDKAHELWIALGDKRASALITRCRGKTEPVPNGMAP
jgi:hypothetical protein